MKDMLKNPKFLLLAIPILLLLWPLIVVSVSLPNAQKDLKKQQTQYDKIQDVITEILKVDSERLDSAGSKSDKKEFNYASALNTVALANSISTSDYTLNSSVKVTTKGKTTQSASVTLKNVTISQFSKFISALQLRWANLQCKSIKLTQRKGQKDKWDIKLDFQYFF